MDQVSLSVLILFCKGYGPLEVPQLVLNILCSGLSCMINQMLWQHCDELVFDLFSLNWWCRTYIITM